MPYSFTTSRSKLPVFVNITNYKVWSKSFSNYHYGLLCAYTPILAFKCACLNLSMNVWVSERWNTLILNLPYSAEKKVILILTLPLFSALLLMISLVIECAPPGWLKNGLTSYLQSPTTVSYYLNYMTKREGSCGTSMRNTSLIFVPDGLGTVLHLATRPSER